MRRAPAALPDFLTLALSEWPAAHARLRAIELRKLLRYPLATPVLDIGCGDGTFTRLLFGSAVEAGLDLQAGEIGRARAAGSHRHLLIGSATHLPFADGSFRSVFSNCVLEHIDGLDRAARGDQPGVAAWRDVADDGADAALGIGRPVSAAAAMGLAAIVGKAQ